MAYERLLARVAGMALVCQLSACGNALTIRNLAVRPDPGLLPTLATAAGQSPVVAMPTVDLKAARGSTVEIALRTPWRTQAVPAKSTADVSTYFIELVANLPGDGGLNAAGTPNYTAGVGNGMNDYSAASPIGAGATYSMPVSDPNLQMRFVNVPNGTYRIRVSAQDAVPTNLTEPDANVGPSGGGRFAISTNSVTLAYGSMPTYNNSAPNSGSGPRLEAVVQLQNGTGDNVTTNFAVVDGNAIPAIAGSSF